MMRWLAIALVLFSLACVTSTSVTRSGLFAPRGASEVEEEEEVPIGLSLTVESIESDGTAVLLLRNYSSEPFVFHGSPDRPRLVIEEQHGDTQARHVVSPWARGQKTHEVPPGERIQLKARFGIGPGLARIGIRHHQFGYTVWTGWIPR